MEREARWFSLASRARRVDPRGGLGRQNPDRGAAHNVQFANPVANRESGEMAVSGVARGQLQTAALQSAKR